MAGRAVWLLGVFVSYRRTGCPGHPFRLCRGYCRAVVFRLSYRLVAAQAVAGMTVPAPRDEQMPRRASRLSAALVLREATGAECFPARTVLELCRAVPAAVR